MKWHVDPDVVDARLAKFRELRLEYLLGKKNLATQDIEASAIPVDPPVKNAISLAGQKFRMALDILKANPEEPEHAARAVGFIGDNEAVPPQFRAQNKVTIDIGFDRTKKIK